MNTFGSTKSKINPKNILGGMGFFEEDFEMESSAVSSVPQAIGGVFKDVFSLGQDIVGIEPKNESSKTERFPSKGTIEFNKKAEQTQKKQAEIKRKKAFYQAFKEDQDRTQKAHDKLLYEDEINDIATNLPTEQKNRLLHYQASYKDRSVYQRAELRRKLIEEGKKAEKQEKAASVPSPAKQPSALEGAFEGRSGTQGSGTSNLSAQAVG